MLIRQATAEDKAAVFSLAQAFATSFTVEQAEFERLFDEILTHQEVFLAVAEEDGKVLGYLLGSDHRAFFANGRVAWVEEIMVSAAHRHQRIGRELMEAFEVWATARGAKQMALATRRAAEFYKTLGYEESAVYFRKIIRPEGIQERAARASREKFEAVLAKVPSDPPDPLDTQV